MEKERKDIEQMNKKIIKDLEKEKVMNTEHSIYFAKLNIEFQKNSSAV